jgi:hypothetical protein
MVPVLKVSIFSKDSALCENDNDKISVTRTDLRFVGEKQYIAEGMTARGKRKREGVFHVIDKNAAAELRSMTCPSNGKVYVQAGPFLIERFMVSNCFQRVEPRTNRVMDIRDCRA